MAERRQSELVKNTVILTVGKICTQFVSFALLPLYTALLDPAEFGIVDLFNTYITLLLPLANWQLDLGLFRFLVDVRKDKEKQKTVFSTVINLNFLQSFIYLALFLLVQPFIHSEFKVFLAIDVVLNIFLNTLFQFARGVGDNASYSIGSFIAATSAVVLNVVFIVFLKWGALGMFLATMFSKVFSIMFLFVRKKIWRYYHTRGYSKILAKEILKYSFPLIPNQLSWWVVGVSDRTIISYVLTVSANGIYSIANKFSGLFITFYNIFNMSWTESVSLYIDDEDRDVFLTETINVTIELFASACIGIIAIMPFVFPLMVDNKYADAYYQIPILMVAVLFQVVCGLYSVVYLAKKLTKESAKTAFFAAVINIAINILLIRSWGLYAASFSTLVAYMAMAIYRYFDVKKYVRASIKPVLILRTILLLCGTLMAYYLKIRIIQALWLVIVGLYAIYFNWSFIIGIFRIIVGKLNHLWRIKSNGEK